MPVGFNWDLRPEQKPLNRRLSFSDADSPSLRGGSAARAQNRNPRHGSFPHLPPIEESEEELTAEALLLLSRCTAPPSSSSLGTAGALYTAPGGMPTPTTGAPAAASLATAPPAAAASPQLHLQGAVAAAGMLVQQREAEVRAWWLAEYQRRRQQELAALAGWQQMQQQAWALEAASAARSQAQQLRLYTVDGGAAGYATKWEELHPVSQRLLLLIEDHIREYKDDSERLDQCSRFDDLSPCNMSFELDASQITQEAGSISIFMDREKISIESLMTVIKEIMSNTEFAIRSYVKLRSRFLHPCLGSADSVFANNSGFSGANTDLGQLLTVAPTLRCDSGAPRRPSSFVQHTVVRFEDHFGECCKWILELEQLVQMKNDKTFAESLDSLCKVMSNAHDYLILVASKVEHIHELVEAMKIQYLNNRSHSGSSLRDPFLEAERREAAKREDTTRIVHPMLHLSLPSQPTPPAAAPIIASQLQKTSFPNVAISPSSHRTLLLPSVRPPSTMETSPAPLANPFGSTGPALQATPYASFSTLNLQSTRAAFGTGIPSSPTSYFPISSGGGATSPGIDQVPRGRRKPRGGR